MHTDSLYEYHGPIHNASFDTLEQILNIGKFFIVMELIFKVPWEINFWAILLWNVQRLKISSKYITTNFCFKGIKEALWTLLQYSW